MVKTTRKPVKLGVVGFSFFFVFLKEIPVGQFHPYLGSVVMRAHLHRWTRQWSASSKEGQKRTLINKLPRFLGSPFQNWAVNYFDHVKLLTEVEHN